MSEFRIPTMSKRVTLKNLVPDSSFEDVANNWNVWLTEPTDTTQYHTGTRSLKLGGDALAATRTAIVPIYGHKYYGREYIKTSGQLDAGDCRFELCGAVNGVEKAYVFGWNRGNYPNWTAISNIVTIDHQAGDGFGVRTFTVGGTVNAWVDSIVVIDLTATCGAGNEPSKEWCDANIPWFADTLTVDVPVSTPILKSVKALTIPEGVVAEIKDASGRVIWSAGGKVVLKVEKVTSDTYAGETTYTGEQFILLDIYPKANGTVKVTYGGLKKTITDTSGADEPNAQQVFFGTFNGVSDSVTTPASGTLTIEGDYVAFGCTLYRSANKISARCCCVTAATDLGNIQYIPDYAFVDCERLTSIIIPKSVTRIGARAFYLNDGNSRTIEMVSPIPPTLVASEVHDGKSEAFHLVGTHNIVVPKGCGSTYKTAEGWNTYADYITEAS